MREIAETREQEKTGGGRGGAPVSGRRRALSSWLPPVRILAPAALFLVVAAAVVGWHMFKYPYLSPIDENAHFDYIRILPDIPTGVDTLSQDSLRMTACRGYPEDLFDQGLAQYPWPPCRSDRFDPNAFPGGGKSTAGSTAPLYYFVTAALTRPIAYVIDIPLVTLVRGVGILWLAGLMGVGYALGRRIGAGRVAAASAAVLVGTSSDAVTSAATVGPDTATAVMGGLVMLAAAAHDGSRRATGWLVLVVALAAVTKLTAITAVGVAMTVLLIRAISASGAAGRARGWLRGLSLAAVVGAVFVVLSLAWVLRPLPPEVAAAADAMPPAVVPWLQIKAQLFFNFFTPNVGNFNASFLESVVNVRMEGLMVGVLSFAVLAGVVALRRNVEASALAWGMLVMAVVGPVVLTAANLYGNNLYFALPPRYGYGFLAGFIALAGWTFRGVVLARALAVLALASFLNVFI